MTALRGRSCCLLANHGQIAAGQSLNEAYHLALEVEELSAQYLELLKLDQVHLLSEQQMEEVIIKFKSYGQHPHHRGPVSTAGSPGGLFRQAGHAIAQLLPVTSRRADR